MAPRKPVPPSAHLSTEVPGAFITPGQLRRTEKLLSAAAADARPEAPAGLDERDVQFVGPAPAERLASRGWGAFAELDAFGRATPQCQDTLWRMGAIPSRSTKVPTKPGSPAWMAQRAGTFVGHLLASRAHAAGGPSAVRQLLEQLLNAADPEQPSTERSVPRGPAVFTAALLQGAAMSVHGLDACPPTADAPELPVVGLEIERTIARDRAALATTQWQEPSPARLAEGIALARRIGALEDAANQKAEAGLRYRIGRYGFMTTWESLSEAAASPAGPRQLVRQASRAFRQRQLAIYATGTLPVGDLAQRQRTEYELLSSHVHGILEISLPTLGNATMTADRASQAARIASATDLPPMLHEIVASRPAPVRPRRTARGGKGWDGATLDLFGGLEMTLEAPVSRPASVASPLESVRVSRPGSSPKR